MQPVAFMFIAASFVTCANGTLAQHSPAARAAEMGGCVLRVGEAGELRAAVRRAGEQLTPCPAPDPQTENGQREKWVVRHPVIVGALIGTGAGVALSRIEAIGGVNHDPRVALVGTGVGAWGGLIASAVHKARAKEKVGVGTKIGIVAGAVGFIALPVLACYGAGGCGGSS